MNRLKLTKARQERFLKALADTGNATAAVAVAGTSRTRVYELRRADSAFAAAWEEAEEMAVDKLEAEAPRRAIEGVPEPLVSAGRLVCGADGEPIAIRRYSDNLLLALLRAHRPPRRDRSVRFLIDGDTYTGGNLYYTLGSVPPFASFPLLDANFSLSGTPVGAVPESASLTILSVGLLGLAVFRRRRPATFR